MGVLVQFPLELFVKMANSKVNFGAEGVGQGSPHQFKALLMDSGFVFNEVTNTFANSGIVRLATPSITGLVETTGILPAGTYYYRVTALTAAGETLAATVDNITVSTTKGVQITWGAVDGAIGYKIYGRDSGSVLLINTIGAVTTWTDTGSITPGIISVPISDTSGAELVSGGGYTANSKVIGALTLQKDEINKRYDMTVPEISWTLSGTVGPVAGLIILDTNETSLADQPIVSYVNFGGDKTESAPTDFIIPFQRIRLQGILGG